MAALETRPYATPEYSSVTARAELLSPAVALRELSEHWEPGTDLSLRFSAELGDDFWTQSRLRPEETVYLVGTVYCPSIRKRWSGHAEFSGPASQRTASVEISVPGDLVAAELRYDMWVVGEGVTGAAGYGYPAPRHPGAKLWELRGQHPIPLEQTADAFPTSALSFNRTGRTQVPCTIELTDDADPGWDLQNSIRIYVNTDLPVHEKILTDKASPDLYAQLEADIYFAVLQRLARSPEAHDGEAVEDVARSVPRSLAALGKSGAEKAGIPLPRALQLVDEDPLDLVMTFREALRIFREDPS